MHLRKYFEKCQSSQKTILYGDNHEKKFSKTWFHVLGVSEKTSMILKTWPIVEMFQLTLFWTKKHFFINSILDLGEQNASQKIFRKMSVLTKNHFIWWWPREKVFKNLILCTWIVRKNVNNLKKWPIVNILQLIVFWTKKHFLWIPLWFW